MEIRFENRGIPFQRGVGGSAALCVSVAGAFTAYEHPDLYETNHEEFLRIANELAFKGEVLFHGNPSGVDNTTSCLGRMRMNQSINQSINQ